MASAFARLPQVRAVALFGSVARPLEIRITRRGWEMLRHCKDVDLAVWIDPPHDLAALNQARSRAVGCLVKEANVGVAHHQVDVFLFEPGSDRYLGRLCTFGSCPKGRWECATPGCGREPLLRQHEAFVFDPEALAEDRIVRLYEKVSRRGERQGLG